MIVAVALVAAASGMPAPGRHSAASLHDIHVLSYCVSITTTAGVIGGLFLRREIRWWDEQARTVLRLNPVVTTTEILERLSHPTAKTVARVTSLLSALVLLYL